MAEGTQTISFRISSVSAKALEDAGQKEGLSRNEYARKLVEAALAGTGGGDALDEIRALLKVISEHHPSQPVQGLGTTEPSKELLQELRRVHAHLNDLRAALATGITCLLAQAGGVEPKEAEAWVTQHMFPSGK